MIERTRTVYVAIDKDTGREVGPGSQVKGPRGNAGAFLYVATPDPRGTVAIRWPSSGTTDHYPARDFRLRIEPRTVPVTAHTPIVPVTARHQQAVKTAIPAAQRDGWGFGVDNLIIPLSPREALEVMRDAHREASRRSGGNKFPAASLRGLVKTLEARVTNEDNNTRA